MTEMPYSTARLSDADLRRWRRSAAEYEALDMAAVAPVPFDKAAQVIERYYETLGDIAERYGLDSGSDWKVSRTTGVIEEG